MHKKQPLFTVGELTSPAERFALLSKACKSDISKPFNYSGKAGLFLKELEQILLQNPQHIDFMTAGSLSLHTIIEFFLHKYGHCMEMFISTWAIKEAAARSLFTLKAENKIGSLHGIFDYRIKTIDNRAFQLVCNAFDRYELTKNHSKVVLIEYKDVYITILCSANLSNNPRIETGFISFSEKTFRFHKDWMEKVFEGKKVY